MLSLLKTFGIGSAVAATLAVAPAPETRPILESAAVALQADLVTIPPGTFPYRQAGEFIQGGRTVEALIVATVVRRLMIMKRQVTFGDYMACVADRVCADLGEPRQQSEMPATRVSWRDAETYARWLSAKTGAVWRLPTDAEWAFAAGSRFRDDALPATSDGSPAGRWLARYEQEANEEEQLDRQPQPIGHFGANENGLLDVAGNVWEWTATCYRRVDLDRGGDGVANCGIRVAEGRHRAYLPDFIRDPRAGGCAVGRPPANLGFRLVREDGGWPALHRFLPWLGS